MQQVVSNSQIARGNSKASQCLCSGRLTEMYPPSKDQGIMGITSWNNSLVIDARKHNFGSQQWTWFHMTRIVCHMTCVIWLIMAHYYKTLLLQIITVLLQNISVQSIIKLYKLKSTMKKNSPNITFILLKNDRKL